MSTAPELHLEGLHQADDFAALEERVIRLVELLRTERQERAKAEDNASTLQQLLEEQGNQLTQTQSRLQAFEDDRAQVRTRVERMMKQLDEIAG